MLTNPHTIRADRLPLSRMGMALRCMAQRTGDSGALPHQRACPLTGVAATGTGGYPALTCRRAEAGIYALTRPCRNTDAGSGTRTGRNLPHGLLPHGTPERPVSVRSGQLPGMRSVPGHTGRASVAAVGCFARRPCRN